VLAMFLIAGVTLFLVFQYTKTDSKIDTNLSWRDVMTSHVDNNPIVSMHSLDTRLARESQRYQLVEDRPLD